MEITKGKLKKIIKEEIMRLAELNEISRLTEEEAAEVTQMIARLTDEQLAAMGLQRTEQS